MNALFETLIQEKKKKNLQFVDQIAEEVAKKSKRKLEGTRDEVVEHASLMKYVAETQKLINQTTEGQKSRC